MSGPSRSSVLRGSGRACDVLVHPDDKAITPDNPDCDNRPNENGEGYKHNPLACARRSRRISRQTHSLRDQAHRRFPKTTRPQKTLRSCCTQHYMPMAAKEKAFAKMGFF